MTARERWDLRGNVQTCRLERTAHLPSCGADACDTKPWSDSTTVEFRPDGAMARHSYRNHDGSEGMTAFEYDGAGQLLAVRNESGGMLVGLSVHEYDAAGRLARVLYRPQAGSERITETYEYSSTGSKTKTQYAGLAPQGPNTNCAWSIEGTDAAYSAPGAVAMRTAYNERQQPAAVHFLDSAGRPVSFVELRYDEAGRLVEEAQTHAEDALPPEMLAAFNEAQRETVRSLFGGGANFVQRTHRYDDQGRRTETRWGMGRLGGDVKTMAYNERGDQVAEIHEREEREFGMDDQGRLSESPLKERIMRTETRIRYEYDAYGNWVLKTVESRAGAGQNFTLSSSERRTLTYFAAR